MDIETTGRTEIERFGIGQPVHRTEDPVLLRGEGRYTDDLNMAGAAHGVFVRSRIAHGVLRGVDTAAARTMPGVLAILTAADLAAGGVGLLPKTVAMANADGTPAHNPDRAPLATDRVRYVGDPVAVVIAQTAAEARDAAEAVEMDVAPLPVVVDPEAAFAPGAPQLYENVPGNVVVEYRYGDTAAVEAAFAAAAHVTRLRFVNNRVVVAAMEPRAAIATFDAASGRYTLHMGSQGVFGMRNSIAKVMGVSPAALRVLTGNVGGSFGMKSSVYPEYPCLLLAARTLGRPVRWADERTESFLSDSHGRDAVMTAALALDAEGRFLALRVDGVGNCGAHTAQGVAIPHTTNVVKNTVGVYRTPLMAVHTRVVVTNTVPVGAYRGAGRPEGNYYMERLVQTAAAEMGIDPIALRRMNQIQPDQMPYTAASGQIYDSGNFPAVLAKAVERADWEGFSARKAASAAKGLLRGRGLAQYLEATAPPSAEMGGVRFEADGTVTIVTGTLDYGQGHAAAFAQVLATRLGVPFERIRLVQGDSDRLVAGGGTGGSRSAMASGNAIAEAAAKVIEAGIRIAAFALEAAEVDVAFDRGRFHVVGTDRAIGIVELAQRLRDGLDLPDDLPRTLDVDHVFAGAPSTFPNGCHICEVEVDPDTGAVRVDRYTVVDDFGVLINPLLVEGQAHGGIVQGIGQALMEHTVYDGEGQLLSGSFMDYALARATDAPPITFASHPSPARSNPLGVKGCGEAGCSGALPSVMNAVIDALSQRGVRHIDMPATPLRVWNAIAKT
jgi:aerobic carbon-monoxide dehydrogenase large subunit